MKALKAGEQPPRGNPFDPNDQNPNAQPESEQEQANEESKDEYMASPNPYQNPT